MAGCDRTGRQAPAVAVVAEESQTPLTVNVSRATLSEQVFQTSLSFGTLKPGRASSLAFARGGRVGQIFADVGDVVESGAPMAELQQTPLNDQLEDLDRQLATSRSELATYQQRNNPTQVNRVQQQIAALTAQRGDVAAEIAQGVVEAPYRGVVADRFANVGDSLPAGRPIYRFIDDAQRVVEVDVSRAVAEAIAVGQTATIVSGDEVAAATVATKAPELGSSSRTQTLKLEFTDEAAAVEWTYGDVVEVRFRTSAAQSGFWLPYTALRREADGLWSTLIVESTSSGEFVGKRILEVRQLEDDHALVSGSINQGDFYIVDGLHRVVPGQRVRSNLVAAVADPAGPPGAGE